MLQAERELPKDKVIDRKTAIHKGKPAIGWAKKETAIDSTIKTARTSNIPEYLWLFIADGNNFFVMNKVMMPAVPKNTPVLCLISPPISGQIYARLNPVQVDETTKTDRASIKRYKKFFWR